MAKIAYFMFKNLITFVVGLFSGGLILLAFLRCGSSFYSPEDVPKIVRGDYVDAIHLAQQLGRLDLVTLIIAALAIIFGLFGLSWLNNLKNEASSTARSAAEEEARKVAKQVAKDETSIIAKSVSKEEATVIAREEASKIADRVAREVAQAYFKGLPGDGTVDPNKVSTNLASKEGTE